MNFSKASAQWANLTSRFGFGKVAGCGCLGCLVPFVGATIFFLAVCWWLFARPVQTQEHTATRYMAPDAPVNGQRASNVPTPVYAPDNAQGATRHPELPSMMGNQPGYLGEGPAAYKPYEGDNSLANKSWYLAQANWTGARRTPYVKGQILSNGMTVVTGDFDFVLLQDASGTQWFCDPSGTNCQFWR